MINLVQTQTVFINEHNLILFSVSDPCTLFPDVKCAHICRIVNEQPVCSCEKGYRLTTDNMGCTGKLLSCIQFHSTCMCVCTVTTVSCVQLKGNKGYMYLNCVVCVVVICNVVVVVGVE